MATVWVNGQVSEQISVSDRAFTYGDGLFATMAVDAAAQIPFLSYHLQRLQDGAARLGFHWQASAALMSLLAQAASRFPAHCLKLQLSRGTGGRGYTPPVEPQVTEVLSVSTLPAHYSKWRQQGITLQTSVVTLAKQPLLAGIKHLNRLEQVLIKRYPLPAGIDDWLVLDTDGKLVETSMANLFLITKTAQGGWLALTPAINYAGVSGVMRQQVIMALLAMGIDVQLQAVSRDCLSRVSHLFISNSLLGIVDVTAVDHYRYQPWPLSSQLRQNLAIQL
ncbi:aminodeoxychorismate lyase [Shewanella dokdonensis]|uniref:Aminodeoxychorismate lyase n=1 Tax=Shewanella dokdonensis TaxID=712036 RepID=A0ABX8DDV3_9GAMM|nr:aminodeoxychorismate lyase [Shewanella dokdonensis]MCL1073239.1 aminodeoxychorismate lyase [Shewanella dokdonensis]QVK22914.1 aminodeoxychorismate lyase [Shewanella dokdonensis]